VSAAPDGRPVAPDGRPVAPDGRPVAPDGRPVAPDGKPVTPAEKTADWVEARIKAWQPTVKERRWEAIGWAKGLGPALRLAKAHDRPVFLFTLDGRMEVGRC
jgi:hypothetical protein